MGLTLHPLTGSNTYRLFFKSNPRRPRRRHCRAGALDRDAAAGHLRGNEMPGLQLLVQRCAWTPCAWSRPARQKANGQVKQEEG